MDERLVARILPFRPRASRRRRARQRRPGKLRPMWDLPGLLGPPPFQDPVSEDVTPARGHEMRLSIDVEAVAKAVLKEAARQQRTKRRTHRRRSPDPSRGSSSG